MAQTTDTPTAQPLFVVVHNPRTASPVAVPLSRVLFVSGQGSKPSRLHYVGGDGESYTMLVQESPEEFALLVNATVRGG